jgi:hypothetical protein
MHLGLGENEAALGALENALVGNAPLHFLKVDPWYEPLRSDPRFSRVLREMHLE